MIEFDIKRKKYPYLGNFQVETLNERGRKFLLDIKELNPHFFKKPEKKQFKPYYKDCNICSKKIKIKTSFQTQKKYCDNCLIHLRKTKVRNRVKNY